MPEIRAINADCRDAIKDIPDNSIDSCVTDPPYSLVSIQKRFGKPGSAPAKSEGATGVYRRASSGFMGAAWDVGEVAFDPDFWAEVFRVLKPGAHLLGFGGTRTYHRLAVAIEDAGFEIRDAIMWHYGTGFPKSHNVSASIDKAARGVPHGGADPTSPNHGKFKGGQGMGAGPGQFMQETGCATARALASEAAAWDGWGTALKPATEIICLARKPLSEPNIAANVLKWGTGALNIDACRIAVDAAIDDARLGGKGTWGTTEMAKNVYEGGYRGDRVGSSPKGRWPANLLHDNSPEVLALFPDSKSCDSPSAADSIGTIFGGSRTQGAIYPGESGSAARFFYSAKAGGLDRWMTTRQEITVSWNSEVGPCQATLLVATALSQPKVIAASGSMDVPEWNTFLFGNGLTALCLKASKSTIKMTTSSTTELKTWSWLTRSLTSDFTPVVTSLPMASGSNPAVDAGNTSLSISFTLAETASLPNASRALSGGRFELSGREKRVGHPTVKPISLMRWLVRLVTPPAGVILDPFAGTGSTGIAALAEGFDAIMVEREPTYFADIQERIAFYQGDGRHSLASKGRHISEADAAGTQLPLFQAPSEPNDDEPPLPF